MFTGFLMIQKIFQKKILTTFLVIDILCLTSKVVKTTKEVVINGY